MCRGKIVAFIRNRVSEDFIQSKIKGCQGLRPSPNLTPFEGIKRSTCQARSKFYGDRS
jgi:hypothetical protein